MVVLESVAHAGRGLRIAGIVLGLAVGACGAQPVGWHDGPSLPAPRFEAASATVDGRIYFVGGITGTTGTTGDMLSATPSSRVDVWDPATRTWQSAPDLPEGAPRHHLAVAVLDARLYVLGGFDGIIGRGVSGDAFRPIATTWVLDGGAWRRLADQPVARGAATAQALGGKIYVAGGSANEGVPPDTELFAYDPVEDRWEARAAMPTGREHLASCVVGGTMLVVGGWTGAERTALALADQYDPATDRWTRLASMPTARGGLGAVTLSGQCHVVGGEDWSLPSPGTFAVHEVFDPARRAWSTSAPLQLARHGIGVTALASELWVIGGGPSQGNSYTDRVEIFSAE